jgi:Tfp pilus assembly protein PilE
MGQQQLLLIILGVIVVGIAVVVGITMFQDNAVSANRDAVSNDLVNLASRAQQLYRRPKALGGCQYDWTKCAQVGDTTGGVPVTMEMLTNSSVSGTWTNANGAYSIEGSPTANAVTLKGVGTEKTGGNLVEVHCFVTQDNIATTVIH